MDNATPPTGALANLNLQDDNQNPGAASPNTVMVDAPEEHVVEPNGTESEDVAIINPDSMETDTLLANDCMLHPAPLPSARALTRPRRGHEGACAPAASRRAQDHRRPSSHMDGRRLAGVLQEGAWPGIPRGWLPMVRDSNNPPSLRPLSRGSLTTQMQADPPFPVRQQRPRSVLHLPRTRLRSEQCPRRLELLCAICARVVEQEPPEYLFPTFRPPSLHEGGKRLGIHTVLGDT